MSSSRPELTAVVVVGPLRERGGECIRSVLDDASNARTDVLVIDCRPDLAPLPVAADDSVRVLPLAGEPTFAAARARGVRAVTAPVVAFVEEHCRVRDGWADGLVSAHRAGWDVVGPTMSNGNPGVGRSDVVGLMSYGLFYPPQTSGETALVPGHNSSYRRDLLVALGDDLERLLQCDLVLMQRLRRLGARMTIEPRAEVAHLNEVELRTVIRGYFFFHRTYGALRPVELGWSRGRRALYVLATPAIPLYALALTSLRGRRLDGWFGILARGLPTFLAAQLSGAVGQAAGILFGAGDSHRALSDYELTVPRPQTEHP